MEIVIINSIELTDDEKKAIDELMDAYHQCECSECYVCDDCPLYVNEHCIGALCEIIKNRDYKKGKDNDIRY